MPPTRKTATTVRTVEGTATVPADATIVIGGITVEDIRNTVLKVPLLGDIPLVGELFKKTNKINNKSKLYVFLTPRIMTDPNFNDLKLFSKGPQSEMGIDDDMPELEPAIIISPNATQPAPLPEPTQQTQQTNQPTPTPTPPASAPELEPAFIELTEGSAKGSE